MIGQRSEYFYCLSYDSMPSFLEAAHMTHPPMFEVLNGTSARKEKLHIQMLVSKMRIYVKAFSP